MSDTTKSNYTTLELSQLINASLIGSPTSIINGVCSIEESEINQITFFNGKSEAALNQILSHTKANAIIVSDKIDIQKIQSSIPVLIVQNPHLSFVELVKIFHPKILLNFGIHNNAQVSETAKFGQGCQVGPFSYIGRNCKIGENTIIHPNVTIYDNVTIGKNCIIHSGSSIREFVVLGDNIVIQNGAVIGADGFGYLPGPTGLTTVPQVGNVHLADHVDIGANTCIDRATLNSTRIGIGTKIDNLVQVGHNTQIGSFSIICGQSAIAGSSKIGNQVVLGGNVGVADHTEVTDGCRFAAFSGLHGKYTEKGDYGGNPAMPAKLYRKVVSLLPKIPDLVKSIKSLKLD